MKLQETERNNQERENMIEWLLVVTGWNESVFRNMTDEEVECVYRERVVDRT